MKITAKQAIDKISKVLDCEIEFGYPEFHYDGTSTYIISGKKALDKLFEISENMYEYKNSK